MGVQHWCGREQSYGTFGVTHPDLKWGDWKHKYFYFGMMSPSIFIPGLPPSGKIRENFDLLESRGKSGNFNFFFVKSQGKSRKMIWLRWPMSMISRHIFFYKNPVVAGAKIFLASLGISCNTHQICVVRSGRVREKCAEKVREFKSSWLVATLLFRVNKWKISSLYQRK